MRLKRKQQTFHDGQWVMFAVDPRKKMILGRLYPLQEGEMDYGLGEWVVISNYHLPLFRYYHNMEAVVYIRPLTDQEMFIGKLNGLICDDPEDSIYERC